AVLVRLGGAGNAAQHEQPPGSGHGLHQVTAHRLLSHRAPPFRKSGWRSRARQCDDRCGEPTRRLLLSNGESLHECRAVLAGLTSRPASRPNDQVQQRRPQERRNVSVRRHVAAVCCNGLLGVALCHLGRTPPDVLWHLALGLGEGPAVGPLPLPQAAFLDAPIAVADRGDPGDRIALQKPHLWHVPVPGGQLLEDHALGCWHRRTSALPLHGLAPLRLTSDSIAPGATDPGCRPAVEPRSRRLGPRASPAYLRPNRYRTTATTTPDAMDTNIGNRNLSRQACSADGSVRTPSGVSSRARRGPLSVRRRRRNARPATSAATTAATRRMNWMAIGSPASHPPNAKLSCRGPCR